MEKISIIYERLNDSQDTVKIKGVMIIDEIELGYIKPRVTFYLEHDTLDDTHDKNDLIKVLGDFKGNVVNIPTLLKTLGEWLKTTVKQRDMEIAPPFEFISNNKNKSSRNKQMMKALNIKDYERIAINHVGKKIT